MADLGNGFLGEFDGEETTRSLTEAVSTTVARLTLTELLPPAISSPAGGGGMLILLRLPGSTWIEPTKRVLGKIDDLIIETVRHAKRGSSPLDPLELMDRVATGRSVAVLALGDFPPAIEPLADAMVVVPARVAARHIASAIAAVTGGTIADADIGHIGDADLTTVVASIRVGSSASACIARLSALTAKSASFLDRPEVPTIDKLVGYGTVAIAWAKSAIADVERMMRGAPATTIESAIFFGPPGTGKTTLANSIAKSSRLPLVSTSVAAWFSRSEGALGDVVISVDRFVDAVMAASPCIAFIDEIDALPSRDAMTPRGREWWTTVIARVLLAVEQIRRSTSPIILLAATNRIEDLDPALVRSGRFDRLIEIPAPTTDEVVLILSSLLDGEIHDRDLRRVACLKPGATGADARMWVEAAKRRARSEGRTLKLEDLLAEAATVDQRSDADRRAAAIHEAGHAVVAITLGVSVKRISILAQPGVGGEVEVGFDQSVTKDTVAHHLQIAMGGRAADETFGFGANAGAAYDLARATRLATWARARWALVERLTCVDEEGAERALHVDKVFAELVEGDLAAALAGARHIVTQRGAMVLAIADALVTRGVIENREIEAIIEDCVRSKQDWLDGETRTIRPAKLLN